MILENNIKKAKRQQSWLYLPNYHNDTYSWEEVLLFLFDESIKTNKILEDNLDRQHQSLYGNVIGQDGLWLSIQNHDLDNVFNGAKTLRMKLNKEFGVKDFHEDCSLHKNSQMGQHNECTCSSVWHFFATIISLTKRHVSYHNDPWDAIYWQCLGESIWNLKNKYNEESFILKPGDVLFLSKETEHEVTCEGPRSGILFRGNVD